MPDERIEGGASGGEEGGSGSSDEPTEQIVTVDVGGHEVSLPIYALVELLRQSQHDSDSSSEEYEGHGSNDLASSTSEDDQEDDGDDHYPAALHGTS